MGGFVGVLGSVYSASGSGVELLGCLDDSLKWIQQAHVLVNLSGISYAWQMSFHFCYLVHSEEPVFYRRGDRVSPFCRDAEVCGINKVYSKGFFICRGEHRCMMEHVLRRGERWSVSGYLGDLAMYF